MTIQQYLINITTRSYFKYNYSKNNNIFIFYHIQIIFCYILIVISSKDK